MGANVIEALEQRRYRPAMRNGEPIEVEYTFKLRFKLPCDSPPKAEYAAT